MIKLPIPVEWLHIFKNAITTDATFVRLIVPSNVDLNDVDIVSPGWVHQRSMPSEVFDLKYSANPSLDIFMIFRDEAHAALWKLHQGQ